MDAVSKVLYGIPIDSYMSINLSAISVLNDAVGGVNVQVIGDLTSVDPTLKEGANVTLLGGQAETYVRSREFDPLDANMARMQRQQQYITAFAQKALQEMKGDLTLPLDLLNLVSENSVTNLSAPKITYLATKVSGSSFSSDNIYSIDCDIKEGETFFGHFHRAGIAQNREHLIFELHEFRTAHTARGRDFVKEDVVTVKLKRTRGAVAAQIAGQTITGEELQNRRSVAVGLFG